MTSAEARTRAAETIDETRSRAGQIRVALESAADHVPEALENARTGAGRVAGRLPDAAERTRLGVQETTTALQFLSDPTLRLLAAASIGLATGLHLAGAPRVITFVAIAPALFAGGAMATRPGSPFGGVRWRPARLPGDR